MRQILLLLGALALAGPVSAQASSPQAASPAVLDARLNALEQRFEDHRGDAREMRSARRSENATEFENVRSEMETQEGAFRIVIGFLLLILTGGGFLLNYVGKKWVEAQAMAAVTSHLTAERVGEMLREQSQPVMDEATERRLAEMDARLERVAARVELTAGNDSSK